MTFVLTGTLESLTRDEAGDGIRARGGSVTGAISRKTTYLVTGTNTGARKTQKAAELGVETLNEAALVALLGAADTPAEPPAPEAAAAPPPAQGELFQF